MKILPRIDWWLLVPVGILISISLVTLVSLNFAFFQSQAISVVIAVVAFLFFSQVNIQLLKQLRTPIYVISVVMLLITLAIGIESHGAVRWIDILGIRFQFSEILKPFLAVAFANVIAEEEYPSFKKFLLFVAYLIPIFLLVYFQPDLGSAVLYVIAAMFALLIAGYPFKWFGFLIAPILVVAPIIWEFLRDYQKQRILTFLNPQADPLGISYNSIQALIAVGSGAFMGKGLSEGTQSGLRFLPERQTDFIFATIAEGLGFVGALIIVGAILLLCYRIFIIFRQTNDTFIKMFCVLSFGFVIFPAFVNIGMNIGVVPIVGVTLPFVSFGGSSLLSNFIFLGILSAMSTSRRHKDVLEIR